MKRVASICGKANLTAKVCKKVQTALLGAGKDEIMCGGAATTRWANPTLGRRFEFVVDMGYQAERGMQL